MAIPRVILHVDGGVVQTITADRPVRVWIVDWDNIKAGDEAGEAYVDVEPTRVAQQWRVVGTRDREGNVIECD